MDRGRFQWWALVDMVKNLGFGTPIVLGYEAVSITDVAKPYIAFNLSGQGILLRLPDSCKRMQFERSGSYYQVSRRHNPEECSPEPNSHENIEHSQSPGCVKK